MGALLKPGAEGFLKMYAPEIVGAYSKKFTRSATHIPAAPTDQQAEVLVPDQVVREDILGIAVVSEDQAHNEILRLKLMGISADGLQIVVASTLFDKNALNLSIRSGLRPKEVKYDIGGSNGK
jgi:hypothetical protein